MYKLSEIAKLLDGKLFGGDLTVVSISIPEDQKPDTLCIISDKRNISLMNGAAAAYVIPEEFYKESYNKPVIVVKSTRHSLVKLLGFFFPESPSKVVVSKKASIASDVNYDESVSIGDFTVVGRGTSIGKDSKIYSNVVIGEDVKIGVNTTIYPNVTIYNGVEIGSNVIIYSGAVIGGDGFGFIPAEIHIKIPHKGSVVIEDYVEIGCNTTIDRGTIGNTVIGFSTKIDNLVQIGHNVRIGRGCLIASQTGISGSTIVGDYVVMGGQVGLADHIRVGSFVNIAAKSGVPNNLEEKADYGGSPAVPLKMWARQVASIHNLPEMRKRLAAIEKKLGVDE